MAGAIHMACAIHIGCAIQVYVLQTSHQLPFKALQTLPYTPASCTLHHIVLLSLSLPPTLPPSSLPSPSLPTSATFTVMSYNVLCDKYATRQQYGYCPSWALVWEYRKSAILKEILDSTADIIALQVSNSSFILL